MCGHNHAPRHGQDGTQPVPVPKMGERAGTLTHLLKRAEQVRHTHTRAKQVGHLRKQAKQVGQILNASTSQVQNMCELVW